MSLWVRRREVADGKARTRGERGQPVNGCVQGDDGWRPGCRGLLAHRRFDATDEIKHIMKDNFEWACSWLHCPGRVVDIKLALKRTEEKKKLISPYLFWKVKRILEIGMDMYAWTDIFRRVVNDPLSFSNLFVDLNCFCSKTEPNFHWIKHD